MKKSKVTRSLLAACSIVALTAVMYGCSSGVSQSEADRQAAEAAADAKAAAEAKAAEDAKKAAEEAEAEKQAALEAERRKAAEQAAAAEKAARATVRMNAIVAAVSAAQAALDVVVLGASDMDISDAEMAVQDARDAITAAVDVDDTSMYSAQIDGIESSLMTAKSLVMQDRASKKMARAEIQKGAIMTATSAAEAAVALVVEGASNEVIQAAKDAVQAARDAITAAVDVDDTSEYTAAVDTIAGNLMTAEETVLADRLQDRIDLQTSAISAAIQKAQSALAKVVLGASDMDISDAKTAVRLADEAIAAAADVEDTSMYTATVNDLASRLSAAETLVIADRAAKKATRAAAQQTKITNTVEAAVTALAKVDIEATDMEIKDARDAVQAARDAIAAAVDVDDTSMYTAQLDGLEGRLDTAEVGALAYRAIQQQGVIDLALDAAGDAVDMVGPDADDDAVGDADDAVDALDDAIEAATNVDDTSEAMRALGNLRNALSDRRALRTAIMDATVALEDLDNDSSDDDIEDVQDLIDAAEDAIDEAEHLSDEEKAAFTAKIDTEDTGLQAMLDAEKKTIMTARETRKTMAAEDMARAQGLGTELGIARAGARTDDGFADANHGVFDSDGDGITATHDGSKVALTITETGGARSGTFEMQDAGPAAISGWTGQNFMRDSSATDDMVEYMTVYTDIDAPKPSAFTADNVNAVYEGSDRVVAVSSSTGLSSFPFADNDTNVAGVTWGSAARPTIVDKTDADTDPDVDSRSFVGYYGGAGGSYSCTGAATACTVIYNEKGELSGFVGTWTFTADRNAKINVPDTAYLNFGWWTSSPTKAGSDGTYSYGFRTFQSGQGNAYTASNIADVTGKATYNGAAAGVYVTQDISGGKVTGATMGEFTAHARLNADFDITAPGIISGSISNFKGADGSAMAGWGVTLEGTSLAAGSAEFGGDTTGTTGPGTTGSGTWEGTFYGNPDAATDAPNGVAGRFDAHLSGTDIAGAFGAHKQ
jgi:hypothetical protein